MSRIIQSICISLAAAAVVGCAAKKQDKPQTPSAMLPADKSVTQVTPSPQDQPPTQNVLPDREDSVAALIRKSEEYARDFNAVRAEKQQSNPPIINQQINVKPAPLPPEQPTQPAPVQQPVANETKTVDISKAPTMRTPPDADANTAAPMTATHANIAEPPPTAKVIAQNPQPPAAPSSDVLEKKLLSRVKEYPRDIAGHLEYQLFEFLKDQPTPDLATLSALPQEDRELVAAVMDGLSNFRNQLRADNNMLLSKKIRPMVDLSMRLQTQAELSVPTLVLCTKVDGFGRYEPIDPPRFIAAQSTQVIVYCEVANFTSRITGEKNLWQTNLSQDIVLYHESGQPVWTDQNSTVQDTSRVRRHDFFVRKLITLPASLQIGRYMLKVTITDQQNNHVAEATLPVQIVAQ